MEILYAMYCNVGNRPLSEYSIIKNYGGLGIY